MNSRVLIPLSLLLLLCSEAPAVQTQPRDLVGILQESPFIVVATVTGTDMIEPGCFRHRITIDSNIKGVVPAREIWSNEAFRVGQRYLIFRTRQDLKSPVLGGNCESRGWYVWGFGIGDALPFAGPLPSMDFQDDWIVVPFGFYEIRPAAHVDVRERRSTIVSAGVTPGADAGTELLISWQGLLKAIIK